MNYPLLRTLLEQHEGFRDKPYHCSAGRLTIGIGHNLENGMDEDVLRQQFEIDINHAIDNCHRLFNNFRDLPDTKQVVLTDMMFNMGYTTLAKFKKLRNAIERRQFDIAAHEMQDSKWCTQVGDRCTTLCNLMKS